MLLLHLLACGTHCDVTSPLDYADDGNWLCRPGVSGACPSSQTVLVATDAQTWTREERTYSSTTGVACFVVYPTLDTRLGAGQHHDIDTLPGPKNWARDQAAQLGSVCDVWVPAYRQAIIGTYAGNENAKKAQCLANAYEDVAAAFDTFLEANPDSPIVLFGHSQGSQHLSRLMRQRFDDSPDLRGRLVGAYLLGWALGTDAGAPVGGSFENIPECTDQTTPGCVIGYGGYFAGQPIPERGRYEEGEERTCVNPAAPGSDGAVTLEALIVPTNSELIAIPDGVEAQPGVLFEMRNALSAQCAGTPDDALTLTPLWDTFDYNKVALQGDLGAHAIDVNVGIRDLVDDIGQRAASMGAR